MDWWWPGATNSQSAPRPPTFPTDPISDVVWLGSITGRKRLTHQVGNETCLCKKWEDTFTEATVNERWRSEGDAGDWSIADGRLQTTVPGAVLTAERAMGHGCGMHDVFRFYVAEADYPVGDKLLIYFDWADAEHCQWVELEHGPLSEGDYVCRSARITIYRRNGSAPEILYGPAYDPIVSRYWDSQVYVEIARAGQAGRWYVYVWTSNDINASGRPPIGWALTEPLGTRCGIGKGQDGVAGALSISSFEVTNCSRNPIWPRDYSWGWAPAAGVQLVAGTIQGGSLASLTDPHEPILSIAPDEQGTADVIVPVYFSSEDRDPRALHAMLRFTDAAENTELEWAVWNYVAQRWEQTLNDGSAGPRHELGAVLPGYAVTAIITSEHMNAQGFAALRLAATSSGTWTLDVRHVVGYRNDNTPENVSFLVTFDGGVDPLVDGQTFELTYRRECGGILMTYAGRDIFWGSFVWLYEDAEAGLTLLLEVGMEGHGSDMPYAIASCYLICFLPLVSVERYCSGYFQPTPPYQPFAMVDYPGDFQYSGGQEIPEGTPRPTYSVTAVRS